MTPGLVSILILAADAPAGTPPSMSVWDFVLKGGPTMAVIALCSLLALSIIAERLIISRRSAVAPRDLVSNLKAVGDPARTLDMCRANTSPLARILLPAIKHRSEAMEAIQKAVADAGRREVARLRHRMRLLSALPQVATMLGLLGTILGMIKTFQAVAASGQSLGKTELLARGIFEAWANTAAGLLVAIPTLIAYHAILGRIDARSSELDRAATDWIEVQASSVPPSRVERPAVEVMNGAAMAATA